MAELADAYDSDSYDFRAGSNPVIHTKKDCNFDTKLQSFLIKSAFVGINPLMVDEIATR